MNILIDSHILLYLISDNHHLLTAKEKELLYATDITLYVSYVSFWELSIKCKRKQLSFTYETFCAEVYANAFSILPISLEHIEALGDIDTDHGDPFDRMLIAQTITEDMKLMTHDKQILHYNADIFA